MYLAHDPGLDRLVALKVPRPELLATGQQRENFLHEARTAARLKHPALVTVHEVQQEGELIYIVQEYIEGQNLAQWAAAQPRSWEDIARRLIEIATAIGYVHQQGFYHRDLKPGNILIDNEGHAHVADFGLAVHEDALRMLKGKAAGTPQYMSPEQVRGETHWIDGRTDIWALGVILYELLAGQRPFAAAGPTGAVRGDSGAGPQVAAHEESGDPQGAGTDLLQVSRQAAHAPLRQRLGSAGGSAGVLGDVSRLGTLHAVTDRAPGATVESGSGAAAGAGSRSVRKPTAHLGHRLRRRTRVRSRRCGLSPRACARSTRRTRTSSWNCCPVRVIARDCPTRSASGRRASRRWTPMRRSRWA